MLEIKSVLDSDLNFSFLTLTLENLKTLQDLVPNFFDRLGLGLGLGLGVQS